LFSLIMPPPEAAFVGTIRVVVPEFPDMVSMEAMLDNKNVLKFEVAEFSDSCLGVPRAGEVCSSSVRQGFRIQVVAQGMMYEFHTDNFGYDIRQFGEPRVAPTSGPAG
jgi:hypothetical protein